MNQVKLNQFGLPIPATIPTGKVMCTACTNHHEVDVAEARLLQESFQLSPEEMASSAACSNAAEILKRKASQPYKHLAFAIKQANTARFQAADKLMKEEVEKKKLLQAEQQKQVEQQRNKKVVQPKPKEVFTEIKLVLPNDKKSLGISGGLEVLKNFPGLEEASSVDKAAVNIVIPSVMTEVNKESEVLVDKT